MTSEAISDLQREMVNLQRQMCHQLEAAQASLSTLHVTESTAVKPTLFHGYEREHFERWQGSTVTVVCWPLACRNNTLASRNLERLAILARRKIFKKNVLD